MAAWRLRYDWLECPPPGARPTNASGQQPLATASCGRVHASLLFSTGLLSHSFTRRAIGQTFRMNGDNPYNQPFAAWTPRHVISATIVAVVLLGLFWLAYLVNRVIVLAFVAMVLSTALQPFIERAARWHLGRLPSAVLVYALLLLVIVGGLVTIAPMLAEQVVTVAQNIPQQYEDLRLEHAWNRTAVFCTASAMRCRQNCDTCNRHFLRRRWTGC